MSYPGVTITAGPRDWQILQRNARGVASVTIEGTWSTPESTFSIQARLVDENTGALVAAHLDWQDGELDLAATRFRLTLRDIPQGGLYRLETRVRRPLASDRRAMRGDCIHQLGVGDLYLIAGQSNASGTGKGDVQDGPQLGVHLFANDETWKLATHPLEDATNTLHPITITSVFHGHSPWLAFAKRLFARTGIPIGLIPTALGGSALRQWVTDEGTAGELSRNMFDMCAKAGGVVKGILWHQGESDCHPESVARYAARFHAFVTLCRATLGQPELPIITGQLGAYVRPPDAQGDAMWSALRETQRQLAHDVPHVYLAVTLDVPLSDEVHNSARANVTVGERYANLALQHLYGLPIQAHFPEVAHVCFTDMTHETVRVTCRHRAGDWTPSSTGDEFTLVDVDGAVPVRAMEITPDGDIHLSLSRPAHGTTLLHVHYGRRPQVTLRDDAGRCLTACSLPVG